MIGINLNKAIMITSHTLNESELGILEKVLGFSMVTKTIPTQTIFYNIEDRIHGMYEFDKEVMIEDCDLVLRKVKPPKCN